MKVALWPFTCTPWHTCAITHKHAKQLIVIFSPGYRTYLTSTRSNNTIPGEQEYLLFDRYTPLRHNQMKSWPMLQQSRSTCLCFSYYFLRKSTVTAIWKTRWESLKMKNQTKCRVHLRCLWAAIEKTPTTHTSCVPKRQFKERVGLTVLIQDHWRVGSLGST